MGPAPAGPAERGHAPPRDGRPGSWSDWLDRRREVDITLQCTYARWVTDLRFEWDSAKNTANQRKHGVSFDEAATVFEDEHALLLEDEEHSDEEDRFMLLGLSAVLRILVVCHCYRASEEVIRVISARKATPTERGEYRQRLP
jgi:uncharacterized DUF497 family protein